MKRILFFLLFGCFSPTTSPMAAVGPGFPPPSNAEMAEFEDFLKSLGNDPSFNKMFEEIMNTPDDKLADMLNIPQDSPLRAPTPASQALPEKKAPEKKDEKAALFHASADWRVNFLHNFDAVDTLPGKDAKKGAKEEDFGFFKKPADGQKKPAVKIPTSLKSAYAKFGHSLGSSLVHLERVVASGTLGAHGRDQLNEFMREASNLLTLVFKTVSKTAYLREFYQSSVAGRQTMLNLHDEIKRIADLIAIRDEEEDDFDDADVQAFKSHQKTVTQLKDLVGKMKNITGDFGKILDLSVGALEQKRKEREERVKKQSEKNHASRDSHGRFPGSGASSWNTPARAHHSPYHGDWNNNYYGGGVPLGRALNANSWGYDDYSPHDSKDTKAASALSDKPASSPVSYPGRAREDKEAQSEQHKMLAAIKNRLLLSMNSPFGKKLKEQAKQKPLDEDINKFYLNNDAPAKIVEYANQLKGAETDIQTLELMAEGKMESFEDVLKGESSKPVDAKHKKEAEDLLKQWRAHVKDVYHGATNAFLQGVEIPPSPYTPLLRDPVTGDSAVVVLPLLGKKGVKESTDEELAKTRTVYRGLHYLRAMARPYIEDEANKIDAARKKAIENSSSSVIAKARDLAQQYQRAQEDFIAAGNAQRAAASSGEADEEVARLAAVTAAKATHLKNTAQRFFDHQNEVIHHRVTPFTWETLRDDVFPALVSAKETAPQKIADFEQIASRIETNMKDPMSLTRTSGKVDDETILSTLSFWLNRPQWRGKEADAASPDDRVDPPTFMMAGPPASAPAAGILPASAAGGDSGDASGVAGAPIAPGFLPGSPSPAPAPAPTA